MYSTFELSFKYVKYFFTSSNGKGHGIHSPFVYQFVRDILNDQRQPDNVIAIENCRNRLKQNKNKIEVLDRGAGSRKQKSTTRSISQIAYGSLKQKKISALLYRMVIHFKPSAILEMGTSFGITTSYMAMALTNQTIITMEGAATIAEKARQTFENLAIKNIQVIEGDFDDSLPIYMNAIDQVGLVYIDGNHRYAATMDYFTTLLKKVNENSILVFDDIYWSAEMEQAWKEIKKHPKVTLTIDLFHIGIVFFRKENIEKENFIIRY